MTANALPEHAAIEVEAAAIGITAEDLPECEIDEIVVAQDHRIEARPQALEETQKSV